MKKRLTILSISVLFYSILVAQPMKDKTYNIENEKVLYTVGYAHLDTEWLWDYPTTINYYIKNTMEENFRLFEKYPDYVFNFTGSRRYNMMKEYYPEMYKKVVEYVKKGQWKVSGSSVDEGEVNISSSESIIRQVLYGNQFFKKEFGKESVDYMLPDCFGFLANLPSIWNHCGLLGFSTQKLTWNSAAGLPFNVGIWNGPDGKGVIAALNATDYNGHVVPRLDKDSAWVARLDDNQKKYGFSFDYRYYGVGDRAGAPMENDIFYAVNSLNNADSKIKVVLSSSDQMFKDITPAIRKKLPIYTGDLLLIEHSAGSMTSQSYMKRLNRKNEILAKSSEQTASIADWLGGAKYPFTKLNNSWDLVLGSQMHDILPGTSIPKAYEYAWNDEFIAANGFQEVLINSLKTISNKLNTNTIGRTIVAYNPVEIAREDIVTAELSFFKLPVNLQVFDKDGVALKTQIIERKENKLKFIFVAKLPSAGLAVYDAREITDKSPAKSSLSASNQSLENEYYRVKVASNGDITSIFDKKESRELLSKPARLEFMKEKPKQWPSWNMDWKDRKNEPIDYMDKEASISVLENGPVRVSLLVKRKGLNSEIEQIISLSAGESGKRIEVSNKLDWQSKEVSLKASFHLNINNQKASYNEGVGVIERANNDKLKFEVPTKEWIDLTDKKGDYGVSILEDCKYGSDKPSDNTLRLTLMYTPGISKGWEHMNYEDTQDWGIHNFNYAIYGHKGNWIRGLSQWQAKFSNQPLIAFETTKHEGKSGKEISLIKTNSPQVGVMAFKKMEEGEYYLVRLNELSGKDGKNMSLIFPEKIIDAYEVNGQEQKIGNADFKNGKLNFDLSHFTIRSFAVKLQPTNNADVKMVQIPVSLPYNFDMLSFDTNRADCDGKHSYPAELIPSEIVSEDVHFKMGNTADREKNAAKANGQIISLPAGEYSKLYILAAAIGDTKGDFSIDEQAVPLNIQAWSGFIGQHYNRIFECNDHNNPVKSIQSPYLKKDNIAWFASHSHYRYPTENKAYEYCYLYKYEIKLPKGAKVLTLPKNDKIIVFGVTLVGNEAQDIHVVAPLFDDFSDSKTIQLRESIK
ncbi:MAG: alpha-mannosidase [Paludibacter sp.]|nr:alpha-mannosidase [Paludibacter sp.]